MAIITGGILGHVRGKVGGIVASSAFGRNTIREYVIPSNPRTAAQQAQRGIFGRVSSTLSPFLFAALRPVLDPLAVGQSGFNLAARRSLDNMNGVFDAARLVVSSGPIAPAGAVLDMVGPDGPQAVWPEAPAGDQLLDDVIHVAVLDRVTGAMLAPIVTGARSDGAANVDLPAGVAANDVTLISWATRQQANGQTLGSPTSSEAYDAATQAKKPRADTNF